MRYLAAAESLQKADQYLCCLLRHTHGRCDDTIQLRGCTYVFYTNHKAPIINSRLSATR